MKKLNISDWSTTLYEIFSLALYYSCSTKRFGEFLLIFLMTDYANSTVLLVTLFAQRSSDLSKRYFRAIPACNFRRQQQCLRANTACFAMTLEFSENRTLLQSQGWIWWTCIHQILTASDILDIYCQFILHSFDFSKNRVVHIKPSLE